MFIKLCYPKFRYCLIYLIETIEVDFVISLHFQFHS